MSENIKRILDLIRSKSRQEWNRLLADKIGEIRNYVRAQGERSALIAFGLGIFLVVFHKLVIVLACIALIAHQIALIIADTTKK